MLTVIAMYKEPRAAWGAQGERSFWAWKAEGERYVTRLLRAVERYLPTPSPVVFLTNHATYGATRLAIDSPGWWAKLEMFRREVSNGKCLYLDLDNVIGDSLADLVALEPDPIIMCDDRDVPRLANGSMMLFDAERLRFLWEEYAADPIAIREEFSERRWPKASDQAFIADRVQRAGFSIPYFQDLLPSGYVLMARELEAGADWSAAHIVCGQGIPKPHESRHPYFAQHWRDAA
jgi:hypothetical protein